LSGVSIYAEAIAYGMQVALSVDLALWQKQNAVQ
jgi:hypothetical protein